MKITDEKRNNIQLLRGLAAIAVVFIHNTPFGLIQVYSRPFMNFSVGLFLFLSGMLSNISNWNPRKRIVKVMIPYILWTLIYVTLYNIGNPTAIPVLYLKNLIAGSAAPIMYYILVYCQFTLLIPLIDKLAKSKYKYLGFLITPIEIVLMRLIPLITGHQVNKYISVIIGISCLGWFTYFYLGYLLGNNIVVIKCSIKKIVCLWVLAIVLEMGEGYWYLSMSETKCGTMLKLSSVLAGVLFAMMAYKFINSDKAINIGFIRLLGDCSFGIYFSHIAIMELLGHIPHYSQYIRYPYDAIVTILISLGFVLVGKKVLGKYGKYLAI